jgi:hypothetical protein
MPAPEEVLLGQLWSDYTPVVYSGPRSTRLILYDWASSGDFKPSRTGQLVL